MKLCYLITLIAVSGTLLAGTARADATEAVTNFAEAASLDRSGIMTITDTISYDFAGTAPHIIQYAIPVAYHDDQGREFRIKFSLTGATLDGRAITLTPAVSTANINISLPAGTGPAATRVYTLSYSLTPVIIKGDTGDILQRSITGSNWTVPINQASVHLDTHTATGDNLTCYTGSQGSTTGACDVKQDGHTATITAYSPLQSGEALTIYTDFPSRSFNSYLSAYEAPSSYLVPYAIAGVIVLAVIIALGVLLYNKANGASKNQAQRD